MYQVYLLKSLKDNKYYIGQTINIGNRLKKHNRKEVKSTKSRTPFILIGYEKYLTRDNARYREYELKNKPYFKKRFILKLEKEYAKK